MDVGATLTLLGGALGVLGVGIAFFSSTLPAALGYTLLVALGAGTVAYRYTGTSVAVAAPALAGSGRRSRRGRTRSRAWRASRSSGLGRRRTRLSSLRAAAGRLVSRVAGPGRDRDDRL